MNSPTSSKKFKIHVDEVKLRHTSHWDLDFLSRKDLDALLGPEKRVDGDLESDTADSDDRNGR